MSTLCWFAERLTNCAMATDQQLIDIFLSIDTDGDQAISRQEVEQFLLDRNYSSDFVEVRRFADLSPAFSPFSRFPIISRSHCPSISLLILPSSLSPFLFVIISGTHHSCLRLISVRLEKLVIWQFEVAHFHPDHMKNNRGWREDLELCTQLH